nr:dienelactone hydrolase family protein [Bifidobacterium leontopitheci]
MTGHVEAADGQADGGLLFVMFHGYGNDESEMVRILDAVVAVGDGCSADAAAVARPGWLSFRGTYDRPYMGGSYWYPDGCDVASRRRECSVVGDEVVSLLDASALRNRRRVLVGFSQGGYLSYRMVREHPGVFDAAILLSPSFKGEEDATPPDSRTRFFLAYGGEDRTIPVDDQLTARRVLDASGRLVFHEYPGMAHAICDAEIADIRGFLESL